MCKESKSEKPDEDYSDGYRDTHARENGNDEMKPKKGAKGAIQLNACCSATAWGTCRCKPVCDACGYGPHMAAHAPGFEEGPDAEPCRHEYLPLGWEGVEITE